MSDDRHDRRIIRQPLGDTDRDFGTRAVVHNAQRQRPSPNPPAGVDFFHREFRGVLH